MTAKEILYIQGRGGVFEPAPSRAQLRKQKLTAERRKQNREELTLVILGALAVVALALFGAWQGALMMS